MKVGVAQGHATVHIYPWTSVQEDPVVGWAISGRLIDQALLYSSNFVKTKAKTCRQCWSCALTLDLQVHG